MAIFDSVKDVIHLVTPVRPRRDINARAAYVQAQERLSLAIENLDERLAAGHGINPETEALAEPVSNTSQAEYLAMVDRAKEYFRNHYDVRLDLRNRNFCFVFRERSLF